MYERMSLMSAAGWSNFVRAFLWSAGYQAVAWELPGILENEQVGWLVSLGFLVIAALGIAEMIEGRRAYGGGLLVGQALAVLFFPLP